MRRFVGTAICTVLALALPATMLGHATLHEVSLSLRGFTLGRLVVASAILLASYLVRGLLWQTMLKPVKGDVRFANALSGSILSTWINNILPFRLGEPARAVLIERQETVNFATALAAIAAERVIDLSTFAALILSSSVFLTGHGPCPLWLRSIVVLISALLGGWLMTVATAARWAGDPSPLVTWLPTRARELVSPVASDIAKGATMIARQPRHGLRAIALSALSGLLQILFVVVYLDQSGYALPYPAYVFGGLSASLVASVPLTLGNVGTYEAAFLATFSFMGLDPHVLAPLVVAMHLTQLVAISVAGAAVLLGRGLDIEALRTAVYQPSTETST